MKSIRISEGKPGTGGARLWVRAVLIGLAIALIVPVTGCDRAKKKREQEIMEKWQAEEAEAGPKRRGLNEGETIVAEFAADGLWHPLPYAGFSGHVLRIETFGNTRNYGDNLVQFRLGSRGRRMIVTNGSEFQVSEAGPLAVRVNPAHVEGLGAAAQIQITRVK